MRRREFITLLGREAARVSIGKGDGEPSRQRAECLAASVWRTERLND